MHCWLATLGQFNRCKLAPYSRVRVQVLIQDSDYYEHYYRALKPNEHFVPVNRSLADLVDKYECYMGTRGASVGLP
jgi:hypothetical protein